MKTPKRKTSCRKCKHFRVTMGERWCNKTLELDPSCAGCQTYAPNDEMKTRRKSKNREAQLKHTIARLQQQVNHLKRRRHQALRIITRWRAWSNKVYEWKENTMTAFRRVFSALCYRNDIQNASGTYGHDIEGS